MASSIDLCKIASGFGYKHTFSASDESELKAALSKAKGLNDLYFIEIKCLAQEVILADQLAHQSRTK